LLRPRRLDIGDGLADHADRGFSPPRQGDAFGAQVVGVRPALEVGAAIAAVMRRHGISPAR
jgi:hypothetical protein